MGAAVFFIFYVEGGEGSTNREQVCDLIETYDRRDIAFNQTNRINGDQTKLLINTERIDF